MKCGDGVRKARPLLGAFPQGQVEGEANHRVWRRLRWQSLETQGDSVGFLIPDTKQQKKRDVAERPLGGRPGNRAVRGDMEVPHGPSSPASRPGSPQEGHSLTGRGLFFFSLPALDLHLQRPVGLFGTGG